MKILMSIFLFPLLLASCEQSVAQQEVTQELLNKKFAEIEALIETGNCTEKDQCSFMPYGSKACGGPQGFLVFSSSIDVVKLRQLVDSYNAAEKRYNNDNGIMSDCSLPPLPTELDCVNGDCIRIQ